jgi:hypothetical protein
MRLQFEGLIEGMIEDGQYPSKQVHFVLCSFAAAKLRESPWSGRQGRIR